MTILIQYIKCFLVVLVANIICSPDIAFPAVKCAVVSECGDIVRLERMMRMDVRKFAKSVVVDVYKQMRHANIVSAYSKRQLEEISYIVSARILSSFVIGIYGVIGVIASLVLLVALKVVAMVPVFFGY